MIRAAALAALAMISTQPLAQEGGKAETIASQVCAACHAVDGNSTAPVNPKIAGQIPEYLHKQLVDFKAQGNRKPERESAVMNGMVANLSEAEMKSLAAYYAGQKLRPAAAGDKELVALGEQIWRGGVAAKGVPACAGCHGPTGAGIPAQYPRLSGQFADYLITQLQAFKEGARDNDPNGMMRSIAAGLSEREIRAVAEYAAGLR